MVREMLFFRFFFMKRKKCSDLKKKNPSAPGDHSEAVGEEMTIHTSACRNLEIVTEYKKVIDIRKHFVFLLSKRNSEKLLSSSSSLQKLRLSRSWMQKVCGPLIMYFHIDS